MTTGPGAAFPATICRIPLAVFPPYTAPYTTSTHRAMAYARSITALLLLAWLTALACRSAAAPAGDVRTLENPAGPGARLPRLAKLPDGGLLMSWVEPADNGHVLKYALLQNGSWVRQGNVARGADWFINWSDFPSVAAVDASFWVAHWLVRRKDGRAYDYDIAVSVSRDAGATWSAPASPHRDGLAAEHGFAVVFPVQNDAGILWLDGRERAAGGQAGKSGRFALRYTRIHRDGRMGPEQVIDGNTCSCCWPAVAVTPAGPVAAWRSRTDREIRDHATARLQQGRWTRPVPLHREEWEIAGCPVNGPALAARGLRVAAAWYTAANDRPRIRTAFSLDGGQNFGQPVEVDANHPSGRIGIAWMDDRSAVVSWITTAPVTGKDALALRPLQADGSMGTVRYLALMEDGRDNGVPQLAAHEDGLVMAWAIPGRGIETLLIPADPAGPFARR